MTRPTDPIRPIRPRWHSLSLAGLLLAFVPPLAAQVSSETIYFVQPDGRSYLLERSLRTPASSHRFFVDKAISRDDLRHVEPQDFSWDDRSREDLNILTFDSGGFTVIFPGTLDAPRLEEKADGVFLYRSWDGRRNTDGRFGFWYSPNDFDAFSYTWIFPDNIELLSHRSNREGDWVRRGQAVSFYASDVNNLTFEIEYRVMPVGSGRAHTPAADACPDPVATAPPAKCPELPAKTSSDPGGCLLDCDDDGVPNRRDACPDSTRGSGVDRRGCAVRGSGDVDGDGVNDARDLCRNTPGGARVDRAGCSLDTDKDGVPDGIDRCLASPEEATVGPDGCQPETG